MSDKDTIFDLITIGGGAAGFFGSIIAAESKPRIKILILEKTPKLLTKVKVSGGGRCNVTHHCFEPNALSKHYPRGSKELKSLFRKFQARDMVEWLSSKGVKTKVENDRRMFPVTNDSQTIIDCFLNEADKHKIQIQVNSEVVKVEKVNEGFVITDRSGASYQTKKILLASGGYNNEGAYSWLKKIEQLILKPIPSLFTFNDSEKKFTDLMGLSVSEAEVKIAGTKFSQTGPVLITHWGLSGPAVIKLSAWAAEYLNENSYTFTALVNWVNKSEEEIKQFFSEWRQLHGRQNVYNNPIFNIPKRLWYRLCELSETPIEKTWEELSNKNLNKLMESLIRCPFNIKGKTTFKEEFVTCGGIDLKSVDLETMESKNIKGLHIAGEVLNIDGETGGFNFQSAWSTAWVAAKAITA